MPCNNLKYINNYTENTNLENADLFLIQKGLQYYRRQISAFIASQAEVNAGTNSKKWITPETLAAFPKTDIGIFDFGMLLVNAQPATNETFTIEVDGEIVIFEFTAGGGVTVGDVEVIKGGTTTLTAAAWIIAINALDDLKLNAIVNPVTPNQINWITNEANLAVTLTDGTSGDIKFSSANDQRAPANTIPILRKYTVTAADVTAGTLMFRFPVSSFPDGVLIQEYDQVGYTSDGIQGTGILDTFTITGGDINISTTSIGAGNIIQIFGMGVKL